MSSDKRILVGDVGGTHARFAVVHPSDAGPWRIEQRLDLAERFATFNDALRSYLERAGVTALPPIAAIAVAGPVEAGTARFTNRGWNISEQALREIGFKRALLINDFAALALAVDLLEEKQLHAIGPQIKGAVAGDLALAHGARGGVYIAGGIAQKIEAFLVQSAFRRRFEDKGRLSPFVRAVPTRLIVNPDVALLGAARAGVLLAHPEAA